MTGVLPLTLETNEGVANTLLNMEWYGLGLDYISGYRDLIYGVSPADVLAWRDICARAAIRLWSPARPTQAKAGDATQLAALNRSARSRP